MAKCGENKGIEALTTIGDSIKKAAERGAAGLDSLATSADDAVAGFADAIADKIPKFSFQDDVRAAQKLTGEDRAFAKEELKVKYSKVPGIDAIIEKAVPEQADVAQAGIYDADGNLIPTPPPPPNPDPCDLPNIEVDADGNVETKPRPANTPSTAPTEEGAVESDVKSPEASDGISIEDYREANSNLSKDVVKASAIIKKAYSKKARTKEIIKDKNYRDFLKRARVAKKTPQKYFESSEFKFAQYKEKQSQIDLYLESVNIRKGDNNQDLTKFGKKVMNDIIELSKQSRDSNPQPMFDRATLDSPFAENFKTADKHIRSAEAKKLVDDILACFDPDADYWEIIGTKNGSKGRV